MYFLGLSSSGSIFSSLVIGFWFSWHLTLVNVRLAVQQIEVAILLSSVCVGWRDRLSLVTPDPTSQPLKPVLLTGDWAPFFSSLISVTEAESGKQANHLPSLRFLICAAQLSITTTHDCQDLTPV